MKYIIYGINRIAKDFLYIFDELEILYFTEDGQIPDEFLGYEVKSLEKALSDRSYGRIILCDFDKNKKEKTLQERGLRRYLHYLYEEDFFGNLDEFCIPDERRLAVWGTGQIARSFVQWNKMNAKYKIDVHIDNYQSENEFCGIQVLSPHQITDWKEYFIIIAVSKDTDIKSQLQALGLTKNKDYISYQRIMGQPSYMLRQTIFDRSFYDLDCRTMLNHLEILNGGYTRCCCTTFVKQNLDNILDKDLDELWHSNLHKIMCLSTVNQTYTFCDKDMCPLFVSNKNQSEKGIMKKAGEQIYQKMASHPKVLALGYDSSCNLSCSTCRKQVHFAKGKELEHINRITAKVKEQYLPNCEFLILAGDGEVFASPSYRAVYESGQCNPRYIRLLSNGTLFTPENWEKFIVDKSGKIMLTVSVDAAVKQTYEYIRRNGNFDILKANMEFASGLRKSGALCYLRMNFVVQRDNFREMIPFVQWGKELGVDEVFFTKILNWGTYTPDEFAEISMMEPDGITPKPELKKILSDPVMQSEIVDLGTIQYAHKEDEIDVVENYYMWELEKRGGRLFQDGYEKNSNL